MEAFTFQELEDDEIFNPSTISSETPFTQSSFYGDWQKNLGRKTRRFLIRDEKEVVGYFQVIKYPLLAKKSYLYIPYGPVLKSSSKELLVSLKKELQRISKDENVVFTRLDFTPKIEDEVLAEIFTKSPLYTYHSAYFQPRLEWVLNLEKPAEEIFKEMHKNTRYSINTSAKKGITVEIVDSNFEEYFEAFFSLMQETSKRNGFHLHPKEYYQYIFENLKEAEGSFLSVAKYNEKILAVNLILVFGNTATYVFAGSSSEERDRLPSYLAQWETIQHAQKLGCIHYNFGGIAGKDNTYKGWDGLTSFKKKFGGEELQHAAFFDVVTDPLWYNIYNFRKYIKKSIGI